MEYYHYLAIVRRYALVIVVITILGGAVATLYALHQPRVYRATVTLLLNPASPDPAIPYLQSLSGNSSGSVIQQLASTYDTYLHSYSFARTIIQDVGLAESPEHLSAQISTDLVGNTSFFHINVQASTPLTAAMIANRVASEFIAQNTRLQEQQAINAVDASDDPQVRYLHQEIIKVTYLDAQLNAKFTHSTTTTAELALAAVEIRLNNLTASYNQLLSAQGHATSPAELNTATVTDPARPPVAPVSPGTITYLIFGAAAGFVISLLLAFALDYLDDALHSPEDVEAATSLLPLAVIGIVEPRQRQRWRRPEVANDHVQRQRDARSADQAGSRLLPAVITLEHPQDAVSEAFRILRTNLAFSALTKPARSLVVTSVLPGEGKSTITANLAIVLAQSGKRVIVIDADLRHPSQHTVFGVRGTYGFSDLLVEHGDVVKSLQATRIAGLRVLTSGSLPANPAELLSSEAVIPLLAALSEQADMLIFDTPPMGALTDAVVLSTRVEGTLMVVQSGLSRPSVLVSGLEVLRRVGARPLGVVINRADGSFLGDSHGRYARRDSSAVPYANEPEYGQQPVASGRVESTA